MRRDTRPTSNPPSAGSTGAPVFEQNVFDTDRYMRAINAGLIDGLPPGRGADVDWPTDEHLIATVVQLGCPRWAADQMRYNPALRLAYYGVWVNVRAMEQGDRNAREFVDVIRATFEQNRRNQLASDDPDATVYMPAGSSTP